MKLIDISWPISQQMTAYKNKQTVLFQQTKEHERDHAMESTITLSAHAGTHIDAPLHFLSDGVSIDQVDLSTHNGWARVLDMTSVRGGITKEDLQQQMIRADDIILLKTANSARGVIEPFDPEFVYLTESGADYLASCGALGVGIDYLGIERNQPDHQTHKLLMNKGISIIEGLRLQHVDAGEYFFICLPLYLLEVEAAPARAVLIQE